MNIPESGLKRVVIIGAGFGGLQLAKKLRRDKFQVVLINKNNYHTFQPLLYQVATSGLEPDSIAHSVRTIIKKTENFYFRLAQVHRLDSKLRKVHSNIGDLSYDYLIIATGSQTNFFGNSSIERYALPMKSILEALDLRSLILQNFETALLTNDLKERERLMTFVIAGGGPTGVELAGALSELKNFILPRDYPDLDISRMNIHLIQATPCLLDGMSRASADAALDYLKKFGVNVWLNCPVKDYNGQIIYMGNGEEIESANLIWAAGVRGALIDGFEVSSIDRGRLLVDPFNRVKDYDEVFAIGDIAAMKNDKRFPNAHPMTAQPAIQQGVTLAKNLNCLAEGKKMKPFRYIDRGSMATVGRNKAVCDLPWFQFKGFFAWLIWMFIHLVNLVGFRNRMVALTNWIIQYFQYNKSVRLIIRPYHRVQPEKKEKVGLMEN
ncbi:NAD(P)/FAD-dependent oxidoreductase [Bacteroidetes bacterium endosymbiont of Geopemphigus sp.]|uniref:NAD(P)/FAD-dependent oxidoreductase n=1 Tax=Bacteroidetes bacterium endosymbiont of Geopemphigus sp. TaxID=2047937 RepID=UPI000CD00186|nr:NAD(P)/FAD-dependent oxidoreductase [Bacteroidetes bacterium endosymbiont of Geopemphigus sp.]